MNPAYYPWLVGVIFTAGGFYVGVIVSANNRDKKNEADHAQLKFQLDNVARLDRERYAAAELARRRMIGCQIMECAFRLAGNLDISQLENLVRRLLMD